MRLREFWQLVDEVLGSAHGRELTRSMVLGPLDQRTAEQALDDGVEPRAVWHALANGRISDWACQAGKSVRDITNQYGSLGTRI